MMKSYYWQNIKNQIVKLKMETGIIFSISFAMCFFMSLLVFFGFSSEMEASVANSLEMEIELKNNFLLSGNNYRYMEDVQKIEDVEDYWIHFVDFLDDMNEKDHLEYANYNISLYSSLCIDSSEDLSYQRVFGISSEDYLNKNEIELAAGRNFTQDEIDQGASLLIVSDQASVVEKGQVRKLKVGDRVEVFGADCLVPMSMEVIGVYKDVYRDFYVNGGEDRFVNSKGMLTSNVVLKNYIVDYHIPIENVGINKVVYMVSDYVYFHDVLENMKDEYNGFEERMMGKYPKMGFEFVDSEVMSVLSSVSRVRLVYQVVFVVSVCVLAVLYAFVLYYFLNRKVAEIGVYVSLGQSKCRVVFHYLLSYLLISLVACCLAMVVGYVVSLGLCFHMVNDNLALQNDFFRYFGVFSSQNVDVNQVVFDYSLNMMGVVCIVVFVVVVGSFSVLCSMLSILRRK